MAISLKIMRAHWRVAGLLSAPLWAFAPSWVAAGPTGGHIVGGSGSITRPNSNLTEIHQGSDRLAIDWQQFNVNANEVVKFIQPSAQSIALNRILDSKQSLILGRIEANGRIFLVNPRGIIFGKDATVNVAGLVASSLDIDSHDFIKGNFSFTDKGGDGVIVNQGTIEAAVGGAVVLLGKVVINEGEIRAPHGSAHLVSAGGAVISFDDNEQLGIQITAEQAQKIANQTDAVRNSGTIDAQGGYIALTGATTADLFTNAVNNEGVLVANSVRNRDGVIELSGGEGNVAQSGQVDVSATDKSNGGKISISGNAIHDTGNVIADGASGGDIQLNAKDLILTENNAKISAVGNEGHGGHIELLADRVGVMDQSRIDASGANGGGVVHVGGEFHGAGSRNAQRTVVDNGVSIYADATKNGNGGEVVVWSDDVTYFVGNIFARGGAYGGDGGNVETSGKQSLNFTGFVDTSAPHGKMGSLLLDPAIINIINGSGGAQDAGIADGIILSGDAPSPYQISEQALEALTSNVTLTATQQINIANLADNLLLFNPNGGTVTFNVTGTGASAASFTMADVNDEIRVVNGNLAINITNDIPSAGIGSITAASATGTLGRLTTTTAGNISITTSSTCLTGGGSTCTASGNSLSVGPISSAGSVSIQGQSRATSSTGAGTSGTVTMALGTIDAGTTVTVSGTSNATSAPSSVSVGGVTITTGNITGGGNVSVTGSTTGSNTSGSGTTLGNVGVTTGTINTSGTVTASATSTATAAAAGTANAGTATTTVGAITTSGAVTLSSTSNASNGLGTQTGDVATVTAADISITGNAPLQITAASSNSNTENVHIGGNYIDNGGNVTITSYTLTLDNNAVIDTTGTITLNYTNLVTNGFTLTQGAINNIYVGDISGSAGAGDLGFSQANITAFAGTGLVLSASNNIFLGTATIDSPSATSLHLIADNDSSGAGDISIASGKTFDLNGRNLIASGVNVAINGSITNSGAGSQQFTTTNAITMGAGSSLTSGSGNIALNAGTGITMANNASVNSTSGQLALTAANNIVLGSLSTGNATTSAINVASTAGAISNAGATTNISASAAGSRVALNAVSGINAALSIADLTLTNSGSGTVTLTNNRALQISSFTNTPATAASITTTGGGSDITIAGNVSSGSNLSFISGGAFTVNNGNTVNSNAGTLSINATGNAAITGLTTTNNTASAVNVMSGGAISDNGATNIDITATGASAVVTLQAASGIGAANSLDLAIANLILSNSTGGAVALTNNRALQINSFTNTPATTTSVTTTGVGSNLTVAGNVASGSDIALTSSGTFSITDGFTINPAAGTITINSTGSATITGLTTTNNTASAISVISGGAITDAGNTNLDITATQANAVVTLQAANGIGAANPLDTAIANLALTNSTSGAVNLTNNRSLQINALINTPATAATVSTTGAGSNMTIAGNVASGGNLALTSSGTFTVNNGFTVNSNAGTLSINATGDAAITGLTTTNNTASAVSVISGGAILDNGNTNIDITATQPNAVVTLQAANGIGAANSLDLAIANLILSNSTSGAVALTNNRALQINSFANTPATTTSVTTTGVGSNLTIAGNVSSGSDIALTSSGTFSIADGFTVNPAAGTIAINSTGNAAITGLTTTNNTASAVSVISGGAITDNGDTNPDISATQPSAIITLQAASGIGTAANPLDISGQIAATNGSAGDIALHTLGSYTFGAIDNSASAGGAVVLNADGNLTVSDITTNNGAITLSAFNNVTLNPGAALQSSGGNVAITANSNSNGVGAITMNASSINVGSGTIALSAAQDINLIQLATTNATTNAVTITSTAGKIIGNFDGTPDITATSAGSRVNLHAATGIDGGGANPLELSVLDLIATNGTSGGINLTNDRALQLSGITNTPATATTITTTGAGSNMTVAGNIASGSNLTLTSSGAFTINSGNTINSNAGTLSINSTGNAAITGLQSSNNTGSAINVTSSTGAITDAGADNLADITTTGAASVVTLQAANGIGSANAIDLNLAGQITATNTTGGDIGLNALTSFTFSNITNSFATGAVALSSSGGSLTVNNITTNNGAITLGAADNITLNSGAALQSNGGNIAITADTNANGAGGIAMNTATVNSGAGTITLSAAQDINLNQLTTTNATTSAVSITSTAGKILGNFDSIPDITAASAGSRVTLHAATGIDAGGGNPLELSVLDLSATNSTSGAVSLTNNRTLQVSSFTNNANSNAAIAVTGAGHDLIFAGTLQNGGGDAVLTATQNINLQNIANVAALSTNSAAVNYAQSVSAGAINSTGVATVAANLTSTTGDINLQTVTLGAGAHALSTASGNNINVGAVTGSGDLQLNSGGNITLTSAALSTGNFSANSATNGAFTANGAISAGAVALNQFSTVNLQGVTAGSTLAVTANTINLSADLLSAGAMTLTGTMQLQNDILLSETGSGGLLQLAGSVNGNAHALTIAASTNTVCIACTAGASASDLAALDIQSSIKSVLGATSVNGNATIRADQEIYLNEDITVGGNLGLLADANNDGIGIAALLSGKNLNVGGTVMVQPIALSSIATPAQCAAPTGLPQMPSSPPPPSSSSPGGQPAFLTPTDVQIAVQESDKYGLAASDAMLRNVSQIAYLGNNCQSDPDTHKSRAQCDVDASMLDFLGTFLIDNQIPKNGSSQ